MTQLTDSVWTKTFDTQTDPVNLADLGVEQIVLFFYPKDNTPGCSNEVQHFNQLLNQFTAKNTAVIGVSRDSVASHLRFSEKFSLNYPLISDSDEVLCKELDVIKPKNMFGKLVSGIERSTFILDKNGKVLKEWRKVKVPGHAEEVLAAL